MSSFRFSISEILVAITVSAAVVAAVTNGSWLSARFLSAFVVIINLTSILLVHNKACSCRGFWIGFALFGLTYLIATDFLSISKSVDQFPIIEFDRLLRRVIEGQYYNFRLGDGDRMDMVNSRTLIVNSLGHLIFSLVGGVIGLVVCINESPRDTSVRRNRHESRDN